MHSLQKKLDEAKGKWAKELHGVPWAPRITMKTATGETLFMLAYELGVVLRAEVALHTHPSQHFRRN